MKISLTSKVKCESSQLYPHSAIVCVLPLKKPWNIVVCLLKAQAQVFGPGFQAQASPRDDIVFFMNPRQLLGVTTS